MLSNISGQNLFPKSYTNANNSRVCSFSGEREKPDTFESYAPNPKYEALAKKIDSVYKKVSYCVFDARLKLYKRFGSPSFSNPEIEAAYERKTFNNLEMCKKFTPREKDYLRDSLFEDGNEFFITLNGQKPASVIGLENHDLRFLNKLKTYDYCKKFDFIHQKPWKDTRGNDIYNTYIVNRKQTAEVINKNRDLFTSRLNLDKDSELKDIYLTLFRRLKNDSEPKKGEYLHDLEGVIFGFPKYNCMIFELEARGGINTDERNNPEVFREKILKTLHGEKSPYKNLSENERKNLEEHINSIKNIESFYNGYYAFIKYCDEDEAIENIDKKAEKFNNDFTVEGLNEKFKNN